MAIFKCKMCGGTIEFEQGTSVGVCEFCGTKQTLPRLDDDKKTNLYDRANHLRRNNEFDKAMGIFESILNEDSTDAEAYWSIVLCRYGIEYVEDPTSHKRVPTVNRAQYTSIFDDEDYKSAIKNSNIEQKTLYEAEASTINEIQKGILEISQKEEPFDVFISFKETGADGRRTRDAVLAHELYNELTKEGYKVFFAPVTLENKLGEAYEPYIFAALNSSKVMVVIGTKPEHFNAVWVKNEWSRFLALIKQGAKKTLIPAYKDMDPYDLPEEFSHLMAQDMSKLGFMQDLIRGIRKITSADAPKQVVKETVVVDGNNAKTAPLLERVFLFLEDGKWQDANIYCEKVLDIDPKNAQAYLGKLMAELHVFDRKSLAGCLEPFDNLDNYSKILRFGDKSLETEMRSYIAQINERNENIRLNKIYTDAQLAMQSAQSEKEFKDAAELYKSIKGYKASAELAEKCLERAEKSRKDSVYLSGKSKMADNTISAYEDAIKIFKSIPNWKDSDDLIITCQTGIEEIKAKEELERLEAERKAEEAQIAREKVVKKLKKGLAIGTPIVCVLIVALVVLTKVIIPNIKYNNAVALMDSGDYVGAYESLIELNRYKDSDTKANKLFGKYISEKAKVAEVGDIVCFGTYEQDNNAHNGEEYIEWRILAKEDDKILVISEKALDCQEYNTSYESVTWETCTLRKWMNGTFLNDAFSIEEQALIQDTSVSADKNPKYDTNPGNATNDKVFLLSITEAEEYFTSNEDRKCVPTEYVIAHGAYDGAATCWWWLRSPGLTQNYAADVDIDGSVYYIGICVNRAGGCVRPALWINLDS